MTQAAEITFEGIGDWKRSHTCGALRRSDVGAGATLMGWVHRVRDHGGVLFVDLRDRYGLTQIVFHPETGGAALMTGAGQLGNEWVIAVRGNVTARPGESVNTELPTGEVELDVRELKLLAAAATLPFNVNEEQHLANEDLRLRYRYLDLRRPELSQVMELRHRAMQSARAYLSGQSFLEIETPMLVKQTPEGARDYVVPSRVHVGKFYALPQSPQLYKQTLMIAGMDRYFQIARCMRDEDLRADRQPEHTQIDLEMSFVVEDDVFAAVEGLFTTLWKECLGVEVAKPFQRLTFDESMKRFGSDKPDLRFGLEFIDVTALSAQSPRNVIANGARAPGGIAVAMVIPGGAEISGTQLRKYEDVVKSAGAGGLTFFKVQDADRDKQLVIFPGELLDQFYAHVGARTGDAVVFTNGPWEQTCKALGVLRSTIAQPILKGEKFCGLEPVKPGRWEFLWVRQFPLFEWDPQSKSWAPRHHMFTMPNPEHLQYLESDPGKVYAQLYDLVLNGNELGSGSIRIHRPDIQERVMRVIGLTHEQAHEKFGFLLEAYQYASPPHGGIGLGLDRIIMLMAGRDNIRDTIAFPKTASAASLMDGCPSEIEPELLKDLGIRF
ncbi:MAG: aspartate--tRNA ligase [Candidatus Eisenbacteria bacterium]|uniref:Aspartate--tRNA(Asp/Asn) ligase n=1 Tax=Eiseniibacteriota bacterium TaxID=2212470 RepID=A0A849SQC2_UNCEI|nr:aspartate--tRNA ligase [Candidatus Eisenbacteria bacterium]